MSKRNIAKTLSVIIPVFAFTIFSPVFEHPTEAKNTGLVLGAYTENLNQHTDADLNVPKEAEKKVEIQQINFPQLNSQAKSYLVYDLDTGTVLLEKNSDQKYQTASLTKLMTAVVAMEDPKFSEPIEIDGTDKLNIAPFLNLRVGDKIYPESLVKAMLVGSANDAALALANHFPNKADFISKMNLKAQELGMLNTSFSNPMGFDSDKNFSSAQDLKRLVDYALVNLPFEDVWKQNNLSFESVDGPKYSIKNSNNLVFNHPNLKSIKTGQTPGAAGNMIIEAKGGNGHKIVVIEIGSEDRDASTLELVDYVFQNFSWK